MTTWTRKSSSSSMKTYKGHHRFEHWYRDNQVYFITARCRARYPAFKSMPAKNIFWDRLTEYTKQANFTPWIVSLLDNHYHILGYCKNGDKLGPMMRKIHGSIAKLVNDLLPERRVPFWVDAGHRDYFDGCIRDEKQCRRAYRYVLTQSVRHGICSDWRNYSNTQVLIDLDRGVKRSFELGAFLEGVPYKRYGQ
ncbi:MAG: transposase [Planctomycetes bacterium]|nr:transposase [Planctomycetota bacterium]